MKAEIRRQVERRMASYKKKFPRLKKDELKDIAMVEVGLTIANREMWEDALLHNYHMVYENEAGEIVQGKARDIYPVPKKTKKKSKKKAG